MFLQTEFSTTDRGILNGFTKVMSGVSGISMPVQEALLVDFSTAHRAGDPHAEKRTFVEHLAVLEWNWPWFDEWVDRFVAAGTWPRLCARYMEAKLGIGPQAPKSLEGALSLISDKQKRTFLKERGLYPSPAPKRWSEWLACFSTVSLTDLHPLVDAHRAAIAADVKANATQIMEEEKLELLWLTVSATVYAERDFSKPLPNRPGWARIAELDDSESGCMPFARPFIEAFNAGDLSKWPPNFPGDMTMVSLRTPYKRAKQL